jgi:hypothetical protein
MGVIDIAISAPWILLIVFGLVHPDFPHITYSVA